MGEEQKKEYAAYLKESVKGFIDKIDANTEDGLKILNLIYGFARAEFLENRAAKGGVA